MNHLLRTIIILAAAQIGVVTGTSAQTWPFNGAGSSALYLEGGEAAAAQLGAVANSGAATGDTFQCLWTAKSGAATGLSAKDGTTTVTENGQSWVAWQIDTTSTVTDCSTPGTNFTVYTYEQTDSVVGNRLLFNNSTITLGTPGATATLAYTAACSPTGWDSTANPNAPVETCNLPAAITTLLQGGSAMTVAGTDIRPEDAAFATLRAGGTGCNASINGTQYLGMGYPFNSSTTTSQIASAFGGSPFNVTNFTLPASYQVFRVGAAPIVVHINQTDGTAAAVGAAGFADTGITNITSGILADILDGTYARTGDVPGATGTTEGITVLLREPLSGTYNTMEYNVPNNLENQTSIDVGLTQQTAQKNCTGTAVKNNPQNQATKTANGHAGARMRVIGTGEMENVIFGTGTESPRPAGPILGWSFWSKPNFQNAYASALAGYTNHVARYLQVDGVDPLQTSYTGGTIPTTGNGLLTSVTFAHVIDGSYPIWSFLRLVCAGAATTPGCVAASGVASRAQNYVALGSSVDTLHPPDFVPVASTVNTSWNSLAVRSHFTPPGTAVPCTPIANGTGPTTGSHAAPECGGDVGGVVYTIAGDVDFEIDFQSGLNVKQAGQVNRRR
ncbi:MAG TPA: hypothetical protein VKB38_10685 [Terracidiphilus sp.]|nr:hypothetical protein [Terracidiphilus sp.]